ncbi:MAG: DUF1289 domain-containing protein [Halioglobus sp.]|jgi:predicted Fe-S protein YdhL (DUF1289 family)|nr:DUF1289 domain-containing protein [Halioglobus sp.]
MSEAEPKSPCISVCAIDENDICTGCYRSVGEITDWFMATAEQKRETLRRAHERLRASTDIRLS